MPPALPPNASVPRGIEVTAAWAWRLLLIAAGGYLLLWLMRFFAEITVPVAIATLLTALTIGGVDWLSRTGVPRLLATFIVVIGLLVFVVGMLALVGQQLSTQFVDLRANVIEGISQVQDWAQQGPLNLSDAQLSSWVDAGTDAIATSDSDMVARTVAVGATLGSFLAGFFIALFSLFFFLYEGDRIWAWVVALTPAATRDRVHSSGATAWRSLTAFVRATVLVALVDAVGIGLSAWALGVPLAFAIAVLVFLGAFVPLLGAFVSGLVAVLVALVAQGPVVAALMLLAVLAVQQLESQVLQPFLMGHIVAVHPLAIILAIAAGVTVAGVVGALIAVPLAAMLNGVARHLSAVADDYAEELPDGGGTTGADPADDGGHDLG